MYLKEISDNELCLLIYKASSKLFPLYSSAFMYDIEEFQQQCCVLILPNLKKYNSSKSKVSTYIYNNLPLLLNRWLKSKEGQSKLYNDFTINLDNLLNDTDLSSDDKRDMFVRDDYDLVKSLIDKEENSIISNILNKYNIVKMKLEDDLSFAQLGKRLHTSKSYARYLYAMELADLTQKYEKVLKKLARFEN